VKLSFLGTGASEGIPAINCQCPHCCEAIASGGRLVRQRTAILCTSEGYTLLIEGPPDIRHSINSRCHGIDLNGVFVSHAHYAHVGGLPEFRYWGRRSGRARGKLDLIAPETIREVLGEEEMVRLQREIFITIPWQPNQPLLLTDLQLVPLPVDHGGEPTYGALLLSGGKKAVYTSDTSNRLSDRVLALMQDADVLVANCPTFQPPKEDHITVVEAVALKQEVNAARLVLTHISHHNKPHDDLVAYARRFPGVVVAYDGLEVEV
jgi:phosphoribosyl 1,2-cyclic phosphate phosphodiesterase